ncbi:MAG: TlpA disulfide reductase family protein [Desulfuromonadaceae bacterium]
MGTKFFRLLHRVAIIALLLLAASSAAAASPRIGEAVAAFSLSDLAGRKIDTAQFRGRVTVIYFWNNLCGCAEQLKALKSFVTIHKNRRLAFVTVNEGQSKAVVESVILANKLPYEALLDNDLSVGKKQFGVKVLPTIFILDKQGILREKLIGAVNNRMLENVILSYLVR